MTTQRDVNETERLRCCQRLDALVHELVHSDNPEAECVKYLAEICAAFHQCAKLGIRPKDAAMLLEPIRKIQTCSPLVFRLQQVCFG